MPIATSHFKHGQTKNEKTDLSVQSVIKRRLGLQPEISIYAARQFPEPFVRAHASGP